MQRKSPRLGVSPQFGSPQPGAKGNNSAAHGSSPWHAVSIVAGSASCEAARAHNAIRYLSREAPRLPLAECTYRESCLCSYKHHGDRRGRPRRKDELIGLRRNSPIATERRELRGRRVDD